MPEPKLHPQVPQTVPFVKIASNKTSSRLTRTCFNKTNKIIRSKAAASYKVNTRDDPAKKIKNDRKYKTTNRSIEIRKSSQHSKDKPKQQRFL